MTNEEHLIQKINEIVENCEEIQDKNVSEYSKRCAKLTAYNEIAELLGFGGES
jgi:hypothetical protein